MQNSFQARSPLVINGRQYEVYRIKALRNHCDLARLPYSIKILLENLLRFEDGKTVTREDILALANYDPQKLSTREISFTPSRVVMQDFTGVPAIVDLAAMRDAMTQLKGDPTLINPLAPAELVIDHSVMVDYFGSPKALERNAEIEFSRNQERYEFLRWGQQAFSDFKVVPPRTGIVHQVNLEYLARVVFSEQRNGALCAYPDTLVGTDSHTTMINGLGVLGWGVGGIEAEAAMLGQPISMLVPDVVGFKLKGRLPEGASATDLVLTVTQMLRAKGVVGKFVEFYGPGLEGLPVADRATIANMAPEYGATCGIFPIDRETLVYLRLTGRSDDQLILVETYARAQGLFHDEQTPEPVYSDSLELDMDSVVPSLAGPKRPQDRINLKDAKQTAQQYLHKFQAEREGRPTDRQDIARLEDEGGSTAIGAEEASHSGAVAVTYDGKSFELKDGAVVIAAITSCTNTSNPSVIMAAGLLAKNAVAKGLKVKPWVKTSLAPGSRVVTEYLNEAGLLPALEQLGFDVVGYGCTTCIGNSGPLPEPISQAIHSGELAVASVLSGNRNFEGRVHPDTRMNFLASPPLVVAYALAGTMQCDLVNEPLGFDNQGQAVYLKDIWPSQHSIQQVVTSTVSQSMFRQSYANVFQGDERWTNMAVPTAGQYQWRKDSTYIQEPPYFIGMSREPEGIRAIQNARVLAMLGDSITTDHISPAGAIKVGSPAANYLMEHGVNPKEFNSYGSRRGNHEVMMRGTFANIRLRNELAPGTEGSWTCHQPSGAQMTIYDAAMRYQEQGVPLVVIAGKEYGTGSSRDWAAKGTLLLGVRAVIAESYERIHRSNLVGMGVLPLQFQEGEGRQPLRLTGKEIYTVEDFVAGAKQVTVIAKDEAGQETRFQVKVRIDTPKEWEYYQHGGILHYVLRDLAA
jgi:aconitate hydratase